MHAYLSKNVIFLVLITHLFLGRYIPHAEGMKKRSVKVMPENSKYN